VPESLREGFFAAASRYLRGLDPDDLTPDQAGIRPKRHAAPGAVADFLVAEERANGAPGWVNLIGIESPGLTCCLEIADRVRALL
jgi:L-2-hydroxyglutarate oxidase LhgO